MRSLVRAMLMPSDDDAESDATLMARYCAGDVAAFHALYRRVAPRMLGYLTGLIGERAAAEDLMQLTFLKVHEARGTYVAHADPLPWLYTIARRTFLDEMRTRRRARVRLVADGALPSAARAELSGAREGETHDAPEAALTQSMLAALATLPAPQREALVLTKLQGRSQAEAAAIIGTTTGAIKLRAHRAYQALRRLLGKDLQLERRAEHPRNRS